MELSGGYPDFREKPIRSKTSTSTIRQRGKSPVTNSAVRTDAEIRELYRKKLWDEKTLFAFNQWLTQVGQKLHVTPHIDVLESGGAQ